MKKIYIYSLLLVLFSSCDNFLEEKSQGEIRPSTLSDMEYIFKGEVLITESEGALFSYETELLGDDMKCIAEGESLTPGATLKEKEKGKWRFIWDPLMFDEMGPGSFIQLWSIPYEKIKGCNIILDYVDEMIGDQSGKNYLKGEALAFRAFYYLNLVNFFAKPYNSNNSNENLGVPLKLTSGVTEKPLERNTVQEVYQQIEKDLLEGAQLMEENPKIVTFSDLTHIGAYALLSRMYLYMENWSKAVEYASKVLTQKPELINLAHESNYSVYDLVHPTEILWYWKVPLNYQQYYKAPFVLSDELIQTYQKDKLASEKDLRANMEDPMEQTNSYLKSGYDFYGTGDWVAGVSKCKIEHNYVGGGIRNAELYLNRAEAYIHLAAQNTKYISLALADLNTIRRNRFDENYQDKTTSDYSNLEELLQFCLRERRRELVNEGNHRWFDLRRCGMPKIEHTFFYKEGEEQYFVLAEKDLRYLLPIPQEILNNNPALKQNSYK